MSHRTIESSPQFFARLAGILYLFIVFGGVFAELFVLQTLVVPRDAAATAANILSHETLFRAGFAVHAAILVCALIVLAIFYQLFKRVDRNAALLMVFFNLVSIAVESISLLAHYAPLVVLKNDALAAAFSPQQLQALAYVPLRLQPVGYDLGLAFFAFFCLFSGLLIIRSGLLPRALGILMVVAGICYLTNSLIHFLAPHYSLFPAILFPCFVAELLLALWLTLRGVRMRQWKTLTAIVD